MAAGSVSMRFEIQPAAGSRFADSTQPVVISCSSLQVSQQLSELRLRKRSHGLRANVSQCNVIVQYFESQSHL